MNTRLHDIAESLRHSLDLPLPPVAVCLADAVPEGVAPFEGAVAAGCSFWELGASQAFATSAVDHALCSIGVHTHNLAGAPTSQGDELKTTLKVLMDMKYVRAEDVAAIPVLGAPVQHVIYAPLASAPLDPSVAVLFAHARHSLVITEAVSEVDEGTPPAMGRPACAAIPQALNSGRATLSLGCCGARAYVDALTDDIALWALPGAKIEAYAEAIATYAKANDVLGRFHALRRASVEAGRHPTVSESLADLQAAPSA